MRPAECALLSDRRLIALLEGAAVCHPAEDTGNELRVVHIAESEEDLILVAHIGVHANVKGVAVFIELRRSRVIGEQRTGGRKRVKIQQR